MKKKTHQSPVVQIVRTVHPNADALSIVKLNEVDQVVIRTADWEGIDKAIWIQPQSIVDTDKPEFSWLKKDDERFVRVKPCKLRGAYSMGCLVKIPEGVSLEIGDDASDLLGVEHWEPEEHLSTGGDFVNGGKYHSISKYDIDSIRQVEDAINKLADTSTWVVEEKIHGCNLRIYQDENQNLYVGSRTNWMKEVPKSVFWKAYRWLEQNSDVQGFLRDYPNYILCGEGYGQVQNLKYGLKSAQFLAFDIRNPNLTYMDYDVFIDIAKKYNLPVVPILLENVEHDIELFKTLATGNSLIQNANCIREGVVIKPTKELWHETCGRVVYKIINPDFK